MASRAAGRPHSDDTSTMLMICLTTARKADMREMSAGSTSTERICPYCVGNCSKRQDRPDRSGRAPAGARGTLISSRFIAASAHATPPPENIAMLILSETAYRPTRTSWPFRRISPTDTIPTLNVRSRSSRTQVAVSARACRAIPASAGETAKLAPSPPNTKGKSRPPTALAIAAITAAPAMFTAL